MRGLASHWPATARWANRGAIASLSADGDDPVLVLRSKDEDRFLKRDCDHELWPLAHVCTHLEGGHGAPIYARAPLTERVRADCDLLVFAELMGQQPKLANCGLWLGSAGNITPFHYDLCHGFLVQLVGRKTFHFVEPEQWRCLYPREHSPELASLDFERWRGARGAEAERLERQRHARFARARVHSVTLEPGDVLYTPPYWWHHVETSPSGPAASVLVPFDQSDAERAVHNVCHHFS